MATGDRTATFRTDVQGLRGVAVALVFLFHTWPALVPGGFVGVDVFFVVSGYLVVGLLLRELTRAGRIDFARFYARRIRRLLPAATTVLLAVALCTPLLLPATRWRSIALDVVGSVLYVENWNLAARSVDYHAIDTAPSPLQHFWSLSIEEQFYLVSPLLLLVAHRLGRAGPRALMAGVFVASLAASVLLSDTPAGYFVSTTRVWELALGGLLAGLTAVPRKPVWGGLGVAAIGVSAFVIHPHDPFPGWIALLPTLGSAAVLVAQGEGLGGRVLSSRALRWIGDRSYSIYLWHWPLVVVWRAWGGELGLTATVAVAAATVGLSELSYRFVEQRFRHAGPGVPGAPAMLLASLVPLSVATVTYVHFGSSVEVELSELHPGGAVLFGTPAPPPADPLPGPTLIREPRHRDYLVSYTSSKRVHQRLGHPTGRRVWLIGDSHAQHWQEAFTALADARGWSLWVDAKMACGLSLYDVEREGEPFETCRRWSDRVLQAFEADPPEIVILGQSRRQRRWDVGKGRKAAKANRTAHQELWERLAATGATVLVIPDIPRWKTDPVECHLAGRSCRVPISSLDDTIDPVLRAARGSEHAELLDLTDAVCPKGVCQPVIGNVFVYRDTNHLTPEYAASIAEEVGRRMDALLDE